MTRIPVDAQMYVKVTAGSDDPQTVFFPVDEYKAAFAYAADRSRRCTVTTIKAIEFDHGLSTTSVFAAGECVDVF